MKAEVKCKCSCRFYCSSSRLEASDKDNGQKRILPPRLTHTHTYTHAHTKDLRGARKAGKADKTTASNENNNLKSTAARVLTEGERKKLK